MPAASTLPTCIVDFETRSYGSVKDQGAWRYAESETTEVLCMGYKIGEEPTKVWVPTIHDSFPEEVLNHIRRDGVFEAHNVQFERAVWKKVLEPKYGVPVPRYWKDTLAVCAYRALPLSLDKVGAALDLPIQKDKHGQYLLNALTTPKWGTKKEPDRIYREDPDLLFSLYDYCGTDVDVEKLLSDTLGDLPPAEYGVWLMDQRINQRGVKVDLPAVDAALDVIDQQEKRLNSELAVLTSWEVESSSQTARLTKWLQGHGIPYLENIAKATVAYYLSKFDGEYIFKNDIPADTLRVLEIRSELAKSSTKKLQRIKETVSGDQRIRGLLQYHGAGTGRWAGRLVQPQNFPRPNPEWPVDQLIADIKRRDAEFLEEKYGRVLDAVSSALRGVFVAEEGRIFRICDFAAIEARATFWVTGCHQGIKVFEASDRGESEDIYCVTASDLVGFPVNKKEHPHERQLGKITVLGCGYQMGGPRLKDQAALSYNVTLTDNQAEKMVGLYRQKYYQVPRFWYNVQDAAIATVRLKKAHQTGKIRFEYVEDSAGKWLACVLPNDRRLWYYNPVIEPKVTPWGDVREGLVYSGRDNKKQGAWGVVYTYGGMLTENIVQAIARDLMVEAMVRVERAGYPVVLTVHDEIISEAPADHGSQEHFQQLMAERPPWAPDCPIAVEGGAVTRYQKV